MTKFKVGDQVLYKRAGLRGIITEKSSENLWAVFFQDKSSRYCFESELELVETHCPYCYECVELNDTLNSDMEIGIYQEDDMDSDYILYACFNDDMNSTSYAEVVINYCPICGRKLEAAE